MEKQELSHENLCALLLSCTECEPAWETLILYIALIGMGLEKGFAEMENDVESGFFEEFVSESIQKLSIKA